MVINKTSAVDVRIQAVFAPSSESAWLTAGNAKASSAAATLTRLDRRGDMVNPLFLHHIGYCFIEDDFVGTNYVQY